MSDVAGTPQELAYETSVQGLARQRDRLSDLRARAATLLAAASIATSFLGAAAINDETATKSGTQEVPALDGWEIVGVGGFCALAFLVIVILLPWRWSGWHTNAISVVRDYVDGDHSAELHEMHRDLAIHNERHFQRNKRKLEGLYWCFRLCCLLLALQVVAWIIDLGVQ